MKECCYSVVGVLIWNDEDQLLMFERNTPPEGIACPAGHVDEHGTPEQAAIAEVFEEVGLVICNPDLIHTGYLPYHCRRQTDEEKGGHLWYVYETQVSSEVEVHPSERETRNCQWYSVPEIASLAHHGKLEPAWKDILEVVGILS